MTDRDTRSGWAFGPDGEPTGEFTRLALQVERLMVERAHSLLTGHTDSVAVAIVSHLAAQGMRPSQCESQRAYRDDLVRRFLSVLDGTSLTEDHEAARALADAALRALVGSPHLPSRGSDVEAWIRDQRDSFDRDGDSYEQATWYAFDAALDDYRLHADTGASLDTPADQIGPHTAGITDD